MDYSSTRTRCIALLEMENDRATIVATIVAIEKVCKGYDLEQSVVSSRVYSYSTQEDMSVISVRAPELPKPYIDEFISYGFQIDNIIPQDDQGIEVKFIRDEPEQTSQEESYTVAKLTESWTGGWRSVNIE